MKKILIISGGISKERAISLDTGKQVAKELKKNNYFVKIAEPNFQLFDVIKKFKPNKIFNALHGQFGEDGYIQTILESFKIPYTHSGVISSSIAMDKVLSKKIFIKNKILTPKFLTFFFGKDEKNIVRTRIFVKNMDDWKDVAETHGKRFKEINPANTLVQANLVGEDYLVEIEAEAIIE